MGLDVSGAPRVLLGGGIGAGKSTISEVFGEQGFSVIDADTVAAEIMGPGSDAVEAVGRRWPSTVANGVVDRSALARIVFADTEELRRLEAITHPAIAAEIDRRLFRNAGPVLVEIPIVHLGLTGSWFKIAVIADSDIRLARAVARGGDADDVRRRMLAQYSDDDWVAWADVVIENSGAWGETLKATRAALEVFA